MTLLEGAVLFVAGLIAGACNAIAGGGVLFTFPAMMWAGLPPIAASVSSAVAVWPGHASAILPYRAELRRHRDRLGRSIAVALAGGLVGAGLLLISGDAVFRPLIPWLLLVATLVFAGSGWLANATSRFTADASPAALGLGGLAFEFVVAIYGGYFGAGLGVLMMAALALLGIKDLQEANALKNVLATVVSSIALIVLAFGGYVSWPHALIALLGAVAGGYLGGTYARRVPVKALRVGVVAVGLTLTAYYFARG